MNNLSPKTGQTLAYLMAMGLMSGFQADGQAHRRKSSLDNVAIKKEYELILQKKSLLPASQRKTIVQYMKRQSQLKECVK